MKILLEGITNQAMNNESCRHLENRPSSSSACISRMGWYRNDALLEAVLSEQHTRLKLSDVQHT
jgi:hypothetical protein